MISIGNLQINKLCLGDVEVTKAYLGDVEVYGLNQKYMTMTVLDGDTGTTIAPRVTGNLPNLNLKYRVNNGSWNDFIVGTTADIQVVAGDVVQFKGVNESGISTYYSNYLNFSVSGNPVALSGNVMSLIDGVGETKVIPNSYCFYKLFSKSNVKTVSLDFLPATELTNYCYNDLFSESILENSPELPALTMKDGCYTGMFYGCQNFTQAPSLPALTLAYSCYHGMFENCTSLKTPQEILPSTVLKERCYFLMYSKSAITKAPSLPAENLSNNCYQSMFSMCTSLTQAPSLPAKNISSYCYSGMFSGCTSLTIAPSLPCTNLYDYCYHGMFSGCSKLTNAPSLPATTLKNRCYKSMFEGCTKLENAPELNATTLAEGCYDSMFFNCSSLTTPPELPATVITDSCYYQMFYNCSNLLTAPELPGENLENHCYERMFMGCHVLEHAPVLNCTTLVDNCYKEMFKGCWELNYVKSMATEGTINSDGTAPLALQNWLYGVPDTGTFVKPAGVSYVTGDSGIPSGWTVEEYRPYMTMSVDESASSTTISPKVTGSLPNLNLQYRINNGDWNDFIVGTTADINVVAGDVVQWKGMNTGGLSIDTKNYLNFVISDSCNLSGNVMSLIDGIGYTKVIPNDYCFYNLFKNSKIKTVTNDFLPATTLTSHCYHWMFGYCNRLTQAPELPATTLASNCYSTMFKNCKLTQAPELPATTLANSCYSSMFGGCKALTTAPELPATTIADYCYENMFFQCTSLTTAPVLPATTLANSCYSNMFGGCTALTTAPELPATTLVNKCYIYMFSGCSNLSYVKSLATEGTINSDGTLPSTITGWLKDVSSTGTFVKPAGVSYIRGDDGIPSGWTIQDI